MSFFDSHGDVLVTKVHKPNSLEHLHPNRFGPRPGSSYSRYTKSSQGSRPASAAQRPASAAASSRTAVSMKSKIAKLIDGDEGPAMIGVQTYPYSRSQRLYIDDFRSLVANTIDHPFMVTSGFNQPSIPHDMLRGSNFDDAKLGGVKKTWVTETRRSYTPQSLTESKHKLATGVRSECIQFLG